tara:strand:- start:37872 stop:39020 length:1149 start_codon:yes stop_codon:yes gene_type:complete
MMIGSLILPGFILLSLFAASLVCTGLIVKLAPGLGLVKAPTSRCSHVAPTPRGGGLAFVVTCLSAIGLLYWEELISGSSISMLFCGGFFIAAIGFWDDLHHLSVKKRLCAQVLVISASVYAISPLPTVELAGIKLEASWVLWAIATFGMVWWLNLFNFMDGIDGLAATEAISVLIMASILICFEIPSVYTDYSVEQALMLLLAVSLLGFMGANWAPAKIFMGDVGSTFLGYMLGMLALMTMVAGSLNLWIWLILPSVFWVDATSTLLRRMIRGERWYQAHQSHAYQRVSRLLAGSEDLNHLRHQAHRKVSLSVLAINVCWLFPLAACSLIWSEWGILFVAMAWMPLVLLAVFCGAGKPGNIEQHRKKTAKVMRLKEGVSLEA